VGFLPSRPESGASEDILTQITTTDLSTLPRRVDRKTGAELVKQHYFPVTPRSLELWPLDWLLVNGKGVCETADLFRVAQAKLDAAPSIPSVRRRVPANA
jgi:hypothetical protein